MQLRHLVRIDIGLVILLEQKEPIQAAQVPTDTIYYIIVLQGWVVRINGVAMSWSIAKQSIQCLVVIYT